MSTATQAREWPINLREWEVRAIRGGRKTQLRRPIFKDDPEHHMPWLVSGRHWQDGDDLLRCPFGKAGDRLRVRESWYDFGYSTHRAEHWTEADDPSD